MHVHILPISSGAKGGYLEKPGRSAGYQNDGIEPIRDVGDLKVIDLHLGVPPPCGLPEIKSI